jgi:hypothetical protein
VATNTKWKSPTTTRTDPILAARMGWDLPYPPADPFSVFYPSPNACVRTVCNFKLESSAKQACVSRQCWPRATTLASAFGTSDVPYMEPVFCNPPYTSWSSPRSTFI